jgi:hypothetical protein
MSDSSRSGLPMPLLPRIVENLLLNIMDGFEKTLKQMQLINKSLVEKSEH